MWTEAGVDVPAVEWHRFLAARKISPQQLEGLQRLQACEAKKKKLGLDLLNDVGLGATKRDLALVIS